MFVLTITTSWKHSIKHTVTDTNDLYRKAAHTNTSIHTHIYVQVHTGAAVQEKDG